MEPADAVERLISYQYGPAVADYYINCPIDGAVKESGPLNTLVRQARLKIDKTEKLVSEFAALTELNYSPKDVSMKLKCAYLLPFPNKFLFKLSGSTFSR